MKVAHIFPAFVPEYLGMEDEVTGKEILYQLLLRASELTGIDFTDFDLRDKNYLHDSRISQYITYTLSCAVSDVIREEKKVPDLVSFFSMGLYAALYHCRSVSFETGLQLIKKAFDEIDQQLANTSMGMCVIGGLDIDDVEGLIRSHINKIEIVNQNSTFSFILSGHKENIETVLENARHIGAMQTRMLPVQHPYHSSFITDAAMRFKTFVDIAEISKPNYKLISSIDQKNLNSENLVKEELVRNLYKPFAWMKTFQFMLSQQVELFIECGAGESLFKTGKFIEGDFKILNCKKIKKYFDA